MALEKILKKEVVKTEEPKRKHSWGPIGAIKFFFDVAGAYRKIKAGIQKEGGRYDETERVFRALTEEHEIGIYGDSFSDRVKKGFYRLAAHLGFSYDKK